LQNAPVLQSAFVVHAPPVHSPVTQVRPLAHWALFVQVDALKVAGVAVHEADVPVAAKLPLLSAKASPDPSITIDTANAKTDVNFVI